MSYPDDTDSSDRLFLHEFLFLASNARGRNEMIMKLPKPEFTTERKSIKRYDMQKLDAARLDSIFRIEMKEVGKDAETYNGSCITNPKEMIQKVLSSELNNRKFRFIGTKISEKPIMGNKK